MTPATDPEREALARTNFDWDCRWLSPQEQDEAWINPSWSGRRVRAFTHADAILAADGPLATLLSAKEAAETEAARLSVVLEKTVREQDEARAEAKQYKNACHEIETAAQRIYDRQRKALKNQDGINAQRLWASEDVPVIFWNGYREDARAVLEPYLAAYDATIAGMGKALEPFAAFADGNVDAEGWSGLEQRASITTWFGPSDFRRARAALPPEEANAL